MTSPRSLQDTALIEDLQAVLLDCLIEAGLHKDYQAAILAGLPACLRADVAAEDNQTMVYIVARIREGLDRLASARPGPLAYDPETPAVRACPRPLSVEKVTV
jgi:hypothetical protein